MAVAEPSAQTPEPSMLTARMHAPLKSQFSSSDVRTDRLFRKVRLEVDELRSTLDALHTVPEEFTMLDLDEVAAHPDAAAALPPALLVRALLESRTQNRRLLKRLGRSESRNGRLSARVHQLKTDRAFTRGRLRTLDEVIATLHGNLEDLRQQRELLAPAAPAPVLHLNGNGSRDAAVAAESA